jgi:hypothetical protein
MYYGNNSISSPTEEPSEVWDSNFMGVWHLCEDPDEIPPQFNDSTANNNDGTANSLSTSNQVQGKIDGSLVFDDTNERHVNVSDDISLRLNTYITLSAWVNTTDTEADVGVIAAKWGSSGNRNYWLGKINAASIAFYVDDTQSVTADLSLINDGLWHHIMGVADVSNSLLRIYVDGIQRNTEAYSGSSEMGTQELHIGHSPDSIQQEWDGGIDEVRVSNKARSAEWIETEFNNQNVTASFLYAGSEEDTSSIEEPESTTSYEWVELYNDHDTALNLTGWYLTDNDGNTFNLTGAGTIPVGGYLVCHLGESGTNSSTHVYGPIVCSGPSPKTMLEDSDDLSLISNNSIIIDFIAWGRDPGEDDDDAVTLELWTDGEYIDTSGISDNETIGLATLSTDTDIPSNWENPNTNNADPYGIHAYSQTPCAINLDTFIVINEILFNVTGGPYSSDWNYYKKITINSSEVAGDLTDFPVLISITDSDLQSKAKSDGSDILFLSSDNETKLDHEIERYNSATGELITWIKIPYLSSTTDTVIYMYYNNSDAENQQNPEGVWSNGYVGIYHMIEDTGSIDNSASSTNDGTRVNTPTRIAARIGYGQEFSGGGADDMFNVGDLGIADGTNENITFSVWANIDNANTQDWGKIVSKRNDADTDYVYDLQLNADVDKDLYPVINGNTGAYYLVEKSTWVHIVVTYNGSKKNFYINGTLFDSEDQTGALWGSSTDTTIGDRADQAQNFGGILDEVRFSSVTRSAEWVETEFNNQNDTGSFYTVGSQDSTSGTTSYEWVELYNNGSGAVNLTGWVLTDNDGNTFYLSGAGSIPVGGYLICHFGESGTNSSTDVYGSIVNSATPMRTMLENTDDLSLLNDADAFFDYVAWGGDVGADDDAAFASGDWDDGDYVDTSLLLENQTLGRDKDSNDTHQPEDWENATGYADPFGIDRSTVNGSSPGAQNIDFIIPEFQEIQIPIIASIIMFAIWTRKSKMKKKDKNETNQREES